MDEMISSTTAGIRRVPGPTPSVDSAPSLSMMTSRGTPKTPFFLTFFWLLFLKALPMFFQKVGGFLLSIKPSSSSSVNSDSTMGCIVRTARCLTMKYSNPESSEKYRRPRGAEGSPRARVPAPLPSERLRWWAPPPGPPAPRLASAVGERKSSWRGGGYDRCSLACSAATIRGMSSSVSAS